MKNILGIIGLTISQVLFSQFSVSIQASETFKPKEIYLYTLNGSKDILNNKEVKKGNSWQVSVVKPYIGMMKIYFPENNSSVSFISENKDVKIILENDKDKIINVRYMDESNYLMNQLQDDQQKKEYILPALYQIKEYYKQDTDFGKSLNVEIMRLSKKTVDLAKYPFLNYYNTNYARFIEKSAGKNAVTRDDIIGFLTNSNDMLETSSLLRPVLLSYLNINPNTNVSLEVEKLLKAVNVETPRGQTILSELIEIFDTYDMKDLKEKFLSQAKNLKCTINDRLSKTITSNNNTEIGAKFPNYTFNNPTNTKAKSIYDVKADKKVIVFWASTCSHCETELPKIIEKYVSLKKQNIEVIAFSLDSNKEAYESKAKDLPWINDSELKGWYSSFAETYNVHATPTYFVLDANNKIIAKPDHVGDLISFLKLN